ncbi:MAG: SGNH/GDSL hydrolase family protein [Gemmatimonadota bacterium]
MMITRLAILTALCTSSPYAVASQTAETPHQADFAVLFVGNSLTYTNDLPGIVEHLLAEYGELGSVYTETVAFPNFGLEDHWSEGTARSRIAAGGWDVVVVQQGPSATEGRPSLIEFSRRLGAEIERARGQLAVYMVWPSAARAFDFDGVSRSHRIAADRAGGLLLPAGDAWRQAWVQDPDLILYGPDDFHPSPMGTYLAALVIYQRLSGLDPRQLPPGLLTPGGTIPLSETRSRLLQEAAAEANRS